MLQETSYHVRSNEVAENVDDRREHGFERRADCRCTMRVDSSDHVQVNAGVVGMPNVA